MGDEPSLRQEHPALEKCRALFPDDLPLAHVYPQAAWHCEAWIIANVAGLEAMRDAITVAIDSGRSQAALYVIDGEGYGLIVERTNSTGLNYTRLPYFAEFCRNDEPDITEPLRARIAELEAALIELSDRRDGASQ